MEPGRITITPPENEPKSDVFFVENNQEQENDILILSLEEEILKTKRPNEIYFRELGKINQYQIAYNKEMKFLIENIHQTKEEIALVKDSQTKAESELNSLLESQKSLISKVIKAKQFEPKLKEEIVLLESEITKKQKEKKKIEDNLKHLTDEILFNEKSKQVDMLKEKKGKIELCLENFESIKTQTQTLSSYLDPEKQEIEKMEKELETIKEEGKNNPNEKYTNEQKDELEAKLKESTTLQETLLYECETLRIALDEKMKHVVRVNQVVNKTTYLFDLLNKYGDKYLLVEEKQTQLETRQTEYNKQVSEINNVISKADNWLERYSPVIDQLNENVSTMENFLNIEIIQKEQIASYNSEIAALKQLIDFNEDRIELLELETKAVEAEISPCELKITKYESEKKLNASKKEFDDIPKLIKCINQLYKEKEDNQAKIKEIQANLGKIEAENIKLLSEIDNKTKLYIDIESELRGDNIQYIKCYESVLNDLPESMKTDKIKEEKKLITEELEALNDEFNDEGPVINIKHKHSLSNVNAFKLGVSLQ